MMTLEDLGINNTKPSQIKSMNGDLNKKTLIMLKSITISNQEIISLELPLMLGNV